MSNSLYASNNVGAIQSSAIFSSNNIGATLIASTFASNSVISLSNYAEQIMSNSLYASNNVGAIQSSAIFSSNNIGATLIASTFASNSVISLSNYAEQIMSNSLYASNNIFSLSNLLTDTNNSFINMCNNSIYASNSILLINNSTEYASNVITNISSTILKTLLDSSYASNNIINLFNEINFTSNNINTLDELVIQLMNESSYASNIITTDSIYINELKSNITIIESNVGINNINPLYTLDINGSINANNIAIKQYIGKTHINSNETLLFSMNSNNIGNFYDLYLGPTTIGIPYYYYGFIFWDDYNKKVNIVNMSSNNNISLKSSNINVTVSTNSNVYNKPILEYPPTNLTSNTNNIINQNYGNGAYIASANAYYFNIVIYDAYNAFNTNAIYGWWGENNAYDNNGNYLNLESTSNILGDWLQLQLPSNIVLKDYYIKSADAGSAPSSWYIFGSTDNNNWNVLDSNINYLTNLPNKTKFSINNNNTSYNYYRLVINKIFNNGNTVYIDNFSLSGYNDDSLIYPPTNLTSNTNNIINQNYGNGLYTASTNAYYFNNSLYDAYNAFNKNSIYGWWGENNAYDNNGNYIGLGSTSNISGDWLQIETPSLITINSYYINVNDLYSAPVSWYIHASLNNSNWKLLDSNINYTWSSLENTKFNLTNKNDPYNYYRLTINKIGLNGNIVYIKGFSLSGNENLIYPWSLYKK
jgi:uncharacterized protein with FMN-binding domain